MYRPVMVPLAPMLGAVPVDDQVGVYGVQAPKKLLNWSRISWFMVAAATTSPTTQVRGAKVTCSPRLVHRARVRCRVRRPVGVVRVGVVPPVPQHRLQRHQARLHGGRVSGEDEGAPAPAALGAGVAGIGRGNDGSAAAHAVGEPPVLVDAREVDVVDGLLGWSDA